MFDIILITMIVALATALTLVTLRFTKQIRDLQNATLGVQYDTGLLAIAVDDAGIPVHDDLRELAFHAGGRSVAQRD